MSIANNVISMNNNLATARLKLRNLLDTYEITYYSTDTIFNLARRLKFIYNDIYSNMYSYPSPDSETVFPGAEVSTTVYVKNERGYISGIPVDFFITVNGTTNHHVKITDSYGRAACSVTLGEAGETDTLSAYLNGGQVYSMNYVITGD